MRKFTVTGILMLLIACMMGCGADSSEGEELVTSVSLQKDGSIKGVIVEDFDKAYYDVNALETMIQEAISDYDKQNPTAEITLESCEMLENENKVKVVMTYDSAQSYAGFNSKILFVGTVQEAYEAGYDMNLTLYDVADAEKNTTIAKQDILNMGTNHIVFMEENMRMKCFGNILYVGDGVDYIGKKTAEMANTQGLSVVMFK